MPTYGRLAADALGISGGRGSWMRRIAQSGAEIDGIRPAALGAVGPWSGRLAAALGRTAGSGGWLHRLTQGGGGPEFVAMCSAVQHSGIATEASDVLTTEGSDTLVTEDDQ